VSIGRTNRRLRLSQERFVSVILRDLLSSYVKKHFVSTSTTPTRSMLASHGVPHSSPSGIWRTFITLWNSECRPGGTERATERSRLPRCGLGRGICTCHEESARLQRGCDSSVVLIPSGVTTLDRGAALGHRATCKSGLAVVRCQDARILDGLMKVSGEDKVRYCVGVLLKVL
jgi:hypothetical protein